MVAGDLKGRFTIRVNGCLQTFSSYEEIPNAFDEIIIFEPKVNPGPHTPQEHDEIELWNYRLQLLMQRCR